MSEQIHKSHNVTILMYHLALPAKYRKTVVDPKVDEELKNVCLGIQERYEIRFLEIGTDQDHVHFLVQSVPTYCVTKIVTIIKSICARQIFKNCPGVKEMLWGGEFWSDGFYAGTVSQHGDEKIISSYVKQQGKVYEKIHADYQLELF